MIDSPPIPPDVELVTYRGVDNKGFFFSIKWLIESVVPVVVNESDQLTPLIQYLAQHITIQIHYIRK